MLKFRLIEKCWQDASYYKEADVDFLLEENDWNDFSYLTTYHLHVTKKRATDSKGAVYLGAISIMKAGQKELEKYLLREMLRGRKVFENLPEGFFSITFSLDIYKGLAQYFNKEERLAFIQSLRLILKEDDGYYPQVKDDGCFQKSLLRNSDMDSFYLLKGRELLLQEGVNYNLRDKGVTVKYADSDTSVTLVFSAIKGMESPSLPNGVIAFIGKNGSGKSTALYKLASLLYASPTDRDHYMNKIGSIEPSDLGISQLMIFSYTPFDNFILPGENVRSDLALWAKGIKERNGRFVFCGLRDVEAEAERILSRRKGMEDDAEADFPGLSARMREVCLKKQADLGIESHDAYEKIVQDKDKRNDWKSLMKSMRHCQPELYQHAEGLEYSIFDEGRSWKDLFHCLSTGHKFFFHSMLHIIAYCEENAMLLFDEPENHLQAPLLSFMMAEIRKILTRRRSVLLVATHSPVILQETMAENVRIVRREGENVSFIRPSIETFGENFGTISSEVFDLTTDRVQYFKAMDEIYDFLDCAGMESAGEAVQAVREHMGGLSSQGIHYVVDKYVHERH